MSILQGVMVVLAAFLLLYVLWAFYLAVMALKHARDAGRLTTCARCFGAPILLAGYALDFMVNMTVVSVLLLELPREWLVTARMSRHIAAGGWRGRLARWFCDELLDPFDPGHCK